MLSQHEAKDMRLYISLLDGRRGSGWMYWVQNQLQPTGSTREKEKVRLSEPFRELVIKSSHRLQAEEVMIGYLCWMTHQKNSLPPDHD